MHPLSTTAQCHGWGILQSLIVCMRMGDEKLNIDYASRSAPLGMTGLYTVLKDVKISLDCSSRELKRSDTYDGRYASVRPLPVLLGHGAACRHCTPASAELYPRPTPL